MDGRARQCGLTLIEVVIAAALFAVIAGIFYALIVNVTRGWSGVQGQLDVQQNPRLAVTRMTAEIEQARDFMIDSAGNALSLVKGTVLTADAAAGATTFTVEDGSVLAGGKPALLLTILGLERVSVTSITGNTVTISPGLTRQHRQGEAVRRDQSTLSSAVSSGSSVSVASGTPFQNGDTIAVGSEAPFTITAGGGTTTLTVIPNIAQSHSVGEVVQIVTVVFKLQTGTSQLTRCTSSCNSSANEYVVADYAAAQTGLNLFSAVQTTLTTAPTVGSKTITVAGTSGFADKDTIRIGRETYGTTQVTPADRKTINGAPGGTTITVDSGVTKAWASGEPVRIESVTINILATRVNPLLGGQSQESAITVKVRLRN